jgi:hypothetical protein
MSISWSFRSRLVHARKAWRIPRPRAVKEAIMARTKTPDIHEVEREVGELPGSVREALLAFCEGRPVKRVSVEAFGRRVPKAEVDAAIARLDSLSFDEI